MSKRYDKARTVTRTDIAREMGWSNGLTKTRLFGKRWLLAPFRVGPNLYNADVIEALRGVYGYEVQTKDERDFLSAYLKNKEIT